MVTVIKSYRRAFEVSKAVNPDWIYNQACRLSQTIYVKTSLFIANNYLLETISKIIFPIKVFPELNKISLPVLPLILIRIRYI